MSRKQREGKGSVKESRQIEATVERRVDSLLHKFPGELVLQKVEERVSVSHSFLPDPETLQGYKEVKEDFPDRYLTMMEKEQEHRHDSVKTVLRLVGRGQIFALILGIVVFGLAAFLLYNDKDIAGYVMLVTGFLAVIRAFMGMKQAPQKRDSLK